MLDYCGVTILVGRKNLNMIESKNLTFYASLQRNTTSKDRWEDLLESVKKTKREINRLGTDATICP